MDITQDGLMSSHEKTISVFIFDECSLFMLLKLNDQMSLITTFIFKFLQHCNETALMVKELLSEDCQSALKAKLRRKLQKAG